MPLNECKKHCLLTRKCKSVNYKETQSENYCQLNSETISSKPNDVIQKTDWIHFATDQTSRLDHSVKKRIHALVRVHVLISATAQAISAFLAIQYTKWHTSGIANVQLNLLLRNAALTHVETKGHAIGLLQETIVFVQEDTLALVAKHLCLMYPEGWTFCDGIGDRYPNHWKQRAAVECFKLHVSVPEAKRITVDFIHRAFLL
eukprot:gene1720-16202_t